MVLAALQRSRPAEARLVQTRAVAGVQPDRADESPGRLPGGLARVPGRLQMAARLGPAQDPLEREADATAARIAAGGAAPAISSLSGGGAGVADPGAAAAEAAVQGSGRPLSPAERATLEPRFGRDLSGISLHEGPEVDAAAAAIGARAYAIGQDIALASGEYAPGTPSGTRLLAHEVTHTVQQAGGAAAIQRNRYLDRAERWARRQRDRAGRAWDRGEQYVDQAADRASERASEAGQAAEEWWARGSGDITRIDFDGSTVRLSGTTSVSYPAVSGLKANNPSAAGIDYTGPEHQGLANMGPIPEGTYVLNPGEVESNPPGSFNTAAWGRYRTRLHETLGTALSRRATTNRTGGFYLHKDGGNNGTAGCIGLERDRDNADIHARIRANSAQIPVHVDYPDPAPASGDAEAAAPVQRQAVTGPARQAMLGQVIVQRDEPAATAATPAPHYLITAGIARINRDLARYGAGNFPADYYDQFSRYLFEVALGRSGRDYDQAFSLLNDLQWGEFGGALGRHYTANVGTDSANGWDKVRHFIFTAYLQWNSGGFLAPEAFTYGKEVWDAAEGVVGMDPEGYSIPDIRADNRGERFAEEMAERQSQEWWDNLARQMEWEMRGLLYPGYTGPL
jgi:hypothetical protein